MKIVGLISGGKDSCYNMMHCVANGHEITALANLHPGPSAADELDSWMYQTVGHDVVQLYEEAMGVPLYRQAIQGKNIATGLHYSKSHGDETEDLYRLLSKVLEAHPDIQGVSVGAIASNYQRLRVENVASRLNLTVFAFLWERDQTELLDEMITAGVVAILIKVACYGLSVKHLGQTLAQIRPKMMTLHDKFGVHPCGEGGEYETIVLDCPLFQKRLELAGSEIVALEGDTAYLKLHAQLCAKTHDSGHALSSWQSDIRKAGELDSSFAELLECLHNPRKSAGTNHTSIERLSSRLETSARSDTDAIPELSVRSFNMAKESASRLTDLLAFDRRDTLFCSLVLDDMADFGAVNSLYSKLWTERHPPARVCIATPLPAGERFRLQTYSQTTTDEQRERRLWVQSRSYWAPSNIGPYSQAVVANGLALLSGQIGLVPSSMQLPAGATLEIAWSLQSLHRIVTTLQLETWHAALVCYFLDERHLHKVTTAANFFRDTLHTGPVETVFVKLTSGSHLPRGAQVEWQYIAAEPGSVRLSVVTHALSKPEAMAEFGFSTRTNTTSLVVSDIWVGDQPVSCVNVMIS